MLRNIHETSTPVMEQNMVRSSEAPMFPFLIKALP